VKLAEEGPAFRCWRARGRGPLVSRILLAIDRGGPALELDEEGWHVLHGLESAALVRRGRHGFELTRRGRRALASRRSAAITREDLGGELSDVDRELIASQGPSPLIACLGLLALALLALLVFLLLRAAWRAYPS